jgi:hypothetical protein
MDLGLYSAPSRLLPEDMGRNRITSGSEEQLVVGTRVWLAVS